MINEMRVVPSGIGCETIAAVLVAYHPDSGVEERLMAAARQVHKLLIVDNTPVQHRLYDFERMAERIPNARVLPNGDNIGLGAAYNLGFHEAARYGYRWVLTLDQDTLLQEDFGDVIRRRLTDAQYRDSRARPIGVIGANFVNSATPVLQTSASAGLREVDAVISSGSITSVDCWRSIGGYRADFFIDYVDIEFCLRASECGYGVVLVTDVLMIHGMGHTSENALFGVYRRMSSNYPPFRHYFIMRNFVATAREHGRSNLGWLVAELGRRARFTLLSLLMEDGRLSMAKATLKGLVDGLRGRMGLIRP